MNDQSPQAEQAQPPASAPQINKPYARNWKKWIPAYILVALVLYGGVYFVLSSKKEANSYPAKSIIPKVSQSPKISQAVIPTTDPTASWKTYTSTLGGFIIKYPPEWEIKGSIGTKIEVSPLSDVISLYSKSPSKDAANGDYMCVELRLTTNSFPIKNIKKTVVSLDNGLKINQLDIPSGIKTFPRLILTNNQYGTTDLLNGKSFEVSAQYNCIQGDIDSIKLSNEQQNESEEFIQATNILSSFKFTN